MGTKNKLKYRACHQNKISFKSYAVLTCLSGGLIILRIREYIEIFLLSKAYIEHITSILKFTLLSIYSFPEIDGLHILNFTSKNSLS